MRNGLRILFKFSQIILKGMWCFMSLKYDTAVKKKIIFYLIKSDLNGWDCYEPVKT